MFRKLGQVAALFTLFLGAFACDTVSSVEEEAPASLRSLDASSQPSADELMSFVGSNLDFQLGYIGLPLVGLDIASEWSPGHSSLVLTSLDENVLVPGLEGDLQLFSDDLRCQLVEGEDVSAGDLNFGGLSLVDNIGPVADACGHNKSEGEDGKTIYTFFCCKQDPTGSTGCSAYKSCACDPGVYDIKDCSCTKVGN